MSKLTITRKLALQSRPKAL